MSIPDRFTYSFSDCSAFQVFFYTMFAVLGWISAVFFYTMDSSELSISTGILENVVHKVEQYFKVAYLKKKTYFEDA